eukprot:scaffold45589_cov67-Phaeocystis_antarctica.AAC.3
MDGSAGSLSEAGWKLGESSSSSSRPLFNFACSTCADDSAAALHAKAQRNHDLNIRESRYHKMRYQF